MLTSGVQGDVLRAQLRRTRPTDPALHPLRGWEQLDKVGDNWYTISGTWSS